MKFSIELAGVNDVEGIKRVWNHEKCIEQLGGFSSTKQILSRAKYLRKRPSLWVARVGEEVIGALELSGRQLTHLSRIGKFAVLPEYRKQGIGTYLYAAGIFQSVIEGRRLFEDSAVQDNDGHMSFLVSIGMKPVGELRQRTLSGKNIYPFQMVVSEVIGFIDSLPGVGPEVLELSHTKYTIENWKEAIRYMNDHLPVSAGHVCNTLSKIKGLCFVSCPSPVEEEVKPFF